jgi:membrane associated rhomboid family serine protease
MDVRGLLAAPVALAIFIMTLITSIRALRDPVFRDKLTLNPYQVTHRKEYYRLFSSGLVHGNTMHLVFNMLAYYFFAFQLEMILGHWQFALLYIGSLLFSDFPTLIRYKDSTIYRTLGASGAISGVVLSFIMFEPTAPLTFIFLPFFSFPAWILAIGFLAYSLFASFRGSSRINHDAHFWGALAGMVFTLILAPEVAQNLVDWVGSMF